jgi:signal transduction histidine kinase
LDSLLTQRAPHLGFIEADDAAAYLEVTEEVVRALTALRKPEMAFEVIKEAERRISTCADCELEEVALYAAAADLYIGLGDQKEALRYQTLRADALTRNEVGKARLAVEQARQRAEFQQQQAGMAQQLEQERVQVRAMDIEHRMQRISLVVMIGFVILFAGVLFVHLRTKRRMQLEEVRTRLSRDLHDDIGSTLSSINILTSVARKKAEAGDVEGAAASLSGISERSQRLQRNMSDIVWSVDPDRDSLEELLVRMREFGASVLEPKAITYHFDSQGEPGTALPPMVKSNLYLIFKEAVNNAAKHAQATQVTVAIEYRNNRLRMTIADDGKGLPEEQGGAGTMGGNGLRNMRKRAEEMNADLRFAGMSGQGTTINLSIPL